MKKYYYTFSHIQKKENEICRGRGRYLSMSVREKYV